MKKLEHAMFPSALALLGVARLVVFPAHADPELEAIVVTAEHRQENAQDVPISMTAITGADLDGIHKAGDITSQVPNMKLASAYGGEAQPTFSLRGVTTNDFSQNQSAPIAMYVDEVYRSVGALQALQTFDLDRVEVLRGPQGTLYGKNATGGAVSYYSRDPSLTAYDGYLTAGGGNYADRTVEGAVGGPINDSLGWRAAAYYEKRDGWMDSIVPGVRPANGIDSLAGRLSFLAKPTDALTISLKLSASHSGGTPYGARPINVDPTVTGNAPAIGFFQNAALYAVDKKIDNEGAALKVDWKFTEHYTLTSITGYQFGRWYEPGDDGSVGVQIYGVDTYASTVNSLSQEIRIASHDTGALSWLGGAYLSRDAVHPWIQYHYFDAYPGSFVTAGADPLTLYGFDQANSFEQVKTSKAVFFNANYEIVPTLTFTGGLRFTRDDISIDHFAAFEGGLATAPTNAGPTQPDLWTPTIPYIPGTSFVSFTPGLASRGATYPELSDSTSNVSYKAGLDWKPLDDVLVYGSVSRGYRGAAFNGQALNSPLELNFARPEELTSYELGAKSTLWEHRLQLNGAIFHYDYHDQQFVDTFAGPTGPLYHTVNAPKSRVTGAELEVRFKATDALELRGNLGLLDSKYQELTLHGIDLSGKTLVLSPKTSVGAAADWRVAQFVDGELRLQLDGNYYSREYFDPTNYLRTSQPGYAVANARTTFAFGPDRRYIVSAWIKNIADREYYAYVLPLRNPVDGGLGLDFSIDGEPRTFGGTITVKF